METLNIAQEERAAHATEMALTEAVEAERREAAKVVEVDDAAGITERETLDAIIAAARDDVGMMIEGTIRVEYTVRQWCTARDKAMTAMAEQRRRATGAELEVVRLGRAARRARGRVTLARTFGGVPTTSQEIHDAVETAIMQGMTLTLDLDDGLTTMGGDDLAQWWEDLAPGEGVEVVGIYASDDDQEATHA